MPYKDPRMKTIRQRHKRKIWRERGLCVECGKPAVENRSRCGRHLHADLRGLYRYRLRHPGKVAEMCAALYRRMVDEGRCPSCRSPLDEDMDVGKITCLNCREGLCGLT